MTADSQPIYQITREAANSLFVRNQIPFSKGVLFVNIDNLQVISDLFR